LKNDDPKNAGEGSELMELLDKVATRLRRSIDAPMREGLSWTETWQGPDNGLICCWERGRQERFEKPDLAARADRGELVPLDWKGGVRKKLKVDEKPGTLKYLATYQGLRGEDLDLDLESERTMVCTRFGQAVVFSSRPIDDEDEE
jgi:hypothetical protein